MAFQFIESLIGAPHNTDDSDNNDDFSDSSDESDIDLDVDVDSTDLVDPDEDDDREVRPVSPDNRPGPSGDGANRGWSEDLHDVYVHEFTQYSGPVVDLTEESEPIDVFELFFQPAFYEQIANETNRYAEQRQAHAGRVDKNWKPVTSDDIRKFIYVNLMFGIHDMPEFRMYWSNDKMLRVEAVAGVMTRVRFETINRYLHIVDNRDQIHRGTDGYDPLFKVRPLLDMIRSRSKELYKPSRAISIDEAMVAFNGRLHFKQYIPSKPHPYGIKVWCAAESKTGYLLNFSVYCGKSDSELANGLGHHVVMTMGCDYLNQYHVFYFDNFFSSLKLAETLLENNTYCCGTIRKNRQGWPLDKSKGKKGTLIMKQKGNILATKWVDKREVNLLSTNSNPTQTVVQRKTKGGIADVSIPTSVADYNTNMGGVDLADQLRASYQVGRASKRWWRYLFWFLVQTAMINSFLLLKSAFPNAKRGSVAQKHLTFRLSVMRSLLQRSSVSTIRRQPDTPAVTLPSADVTHTCSRLDGRKKRCFQCAADKKKTPKGRTPETVYGCSKCAVHLCEGRCFSKFHKLI